MFPGLGSNPISFNRTQLLRWLQFYDGILETTGEDKPPEDMWDNDYELDRFLKNRQRRREEEEQKRRSRG